jgi:hypothetical protein
MEERIPLTGNQLDKIFPYQPTRYGYGYGSHRVFNPSAEIPPEALKTPENIRFGKVIYDTLSASFSRTSFSTPIRLKEVMYVVEEYRGPSQGRAISPA